MTGDTNTGEEKGSIRILFQNTGGLINASTESSGHKLNTLKKILHNGEVSILGLAEVNSDYKKLPLKDNLYH